MFAISDVSVTMSLVTMGLTVHVVIKHKDFLHLYWQFLYIFYAIYIRYSRFRKRKYIYIANFDELSQSTAEIKLLPVSDDGQPPY